MPVADQDLKPCLAAAAANLTYNAPLDQRRDGYLSGYREIVGFGWLILTPA